MGAYQVTFDPTSAVPEDQFDPTSAMPESAPSTRDVINAAVRFNPDQAAQADRLSRKYPLEPNTLLRNLQNVQLQEIVDKYDQTLQTSPKLSRYMREKPWLAAQAHDDLEPLKGVESSFAALAAAGAAQAALGISESIWRTPDAAQRMVGYLASLPEMAGLPWYLNPIRGVQDVIRFVSEGRIPGVERRIGGTTDIANRVAGAMDILAEDRATFGDAFGDLSVLSQNADRALRTAIETGRVEQLGQVLTDPNYWAAFLGQAAPSLYAAIKSGGSLAFMGWLEGMEQASSAADFEVRTGVKVTDAEFAQATMQTAIINAVLEKAGIDRVLGAQGKGLKGVVKAMLGEGGTEALQQVNTNLAALLAYDEGRELLEGVVSSFMGGAGAGGGVATVTAAAGKAQEIIDQRQRQIQDAVTNADKLAAAMQAAAQSKLRERNPDTFKELVQRMAAETDGAPASVYIDAQVLAQSGVDVAQVFPSAAAQMDEALAGNGTVEIAIEEVLTSVPGTPLEQVFLQNARLSPESLSRIEAQQAADQAREFLKQDAERVLAQAADQAAWQQSANTVKQKILDQLNQAGRFTSDVNEAYATLQANFFSSMAARLGTTPDKLYERYELKVAAKSPGGQVLNSGRKLGEVEVEAFHYSRAPRHVVTTRAFGTAKVEDTIFADQKTGLMPEWTWTEGRAPDMPDQVLEQSGVVRVIYRGTNDSGERISGGIAEGTLFAAADEATAKNYAGTGGKIERIGVKQDAKVLVEGTKEFAQVTGRRRGKLIDTMRKGENLKTAADDAAAKARAAGYDALEFTSLKDLGIAIFNEDKFVRDYSPSQQLNQSPAFDGPEVGNTPIGDATEIEVDGKQRPTRNSDGQLIHPTEEGIRNFWRWFGDSKVVDEQGRPLVVYHGTRADFSEFDTDRIGQNFAESKGGFFFTGSQAAASAYASIRGGEGGNVMPAYLSLQNPLTLDTYLWATGDTVESALTDREYKLIDLFDEDPAGVIAYAKDGGHDGIFWKNGKDVLAVAFDPAQIKSATGNRGTFDPNSPNILEQGPRGTFDPKQLLITLNENADLSTFLHESGHFFLEVMADLASQPNAPQQIVDDMATILKWFGIKGDEQVGGSDSGAPLAQQDAEAVSEAIYKEMAADDDLVAALEAWMVDGTQPDAATNEKLLGYMRRMPPVPRDSYLTFYRGQPRGVAPHSRGWASWTTNPDTTRFFTEGDSEVLQRKGVQGISLEQIALWRTRLTGELTDYGSQGEWLVLNESVFAQGGDLPTDTTKPAGRTPLEVWNAMTLDQKRPYHERWAESFEQYLFEGKAPSQELQPLFRRFRSWLINVYKSLKQFMLGRNLQVSDDIRKVFDRMIATDEEIAQAEEAAGMLPDFEATNEAIEKLQARSLRDLKWAVNARNKTIKALQKQAAKLRKEVDAEVRAEVEQQPVYRAMRWLKKGETVDPATGELKKTEGSHRLATGALADMYPETMPDRPDLTRLRGMTAKDGVHPDVVADMFGFESGDALVRAIIDAAPINEVVEGLTEQRMLERHGDLVDQRAIEDAANEAVHNEARARALATELKAQTEMLNLRQATGRTASNGRPITVNAITEAAKQFAQNLAARRRVKDLKSAAWQHRAAEARAAKRWQQATAKGDTQAAVQAKRDQLLNNYAAKALHDAQGEVKKILEFFRKVTKGNNEKIVERGRDPDVVNAMRAILAAYGVAPRLEKSALAYMETVAKNDPVMYAALKPSVDSALLNAKPLDELTLEELRGLNDELRAMWELAKRSRQMEVDGNLLDIEEAADKLLARMEEIGIPTEIPGERAAITDREEAGIKLQFAKAILSRVEQWAERMDGKFGGPFLRLVFQPIKEAADRYRTARVDYRKRFTALVENIAPILTPGAIPAPELNYTFGNARDSGQAELLHAILHTGNESNKRKLLLGRGWATELEDGTLDTSRWDAFIARMIAEGKITKAHYDFAQGVWDLLEEMKPLAQETHRKVFGRYFAEVTATPFSTPFGSYRGGYVPAQVDPRIVTDAKLRELAEAENESMAYAFPASPSGFTKSRVEYNKPLLLDLRALAQHMDKVLLFSYMQGPVTDVRRLLTNKRVSYALDRIDPSAYEGMLLPWLNRAAKQIVETPVAGDRRLSRFLSAARSRAGMALMFANLSNTVQQITGFSLAAVKVKPSLMMKAAASFIAAPKAMKEQVATASEFMRNRMLNEVAAMNDAVEQILVNATALEKAKDWTQRHAYFLQAAVDNTMSPIIWTAAYNQAIEQKMSHKDAVRFADGVIRQTQGTTLPEDISRFESGPAPLRLFTQFVSYFNMMANTNATAVKQIADEMGLRKGAGRLLYVALAGLLVPIWVAEAIAQAFRGGPDDEDDDGYLDDWLMAVFGLGTLRGLTAQVPIVGQAAQLAVNRFNDNPADDKFSLSPAVSLIESAVSSPVSVYKAIVEEGSAQKAVRDVATAATLITGLPIYAAARPVGYLAGMADGRIEPTGAVDLARGLVTGVASPESKAP